MLAFNTTMPAVAPVSSLISHAIDSAGSSVRERQQLSGLARFPASMILLPGLIALIVVALKVY